ncbi:MAG: hypothetical protein AAGI17_09785 [Planctomycetota bacterium]
MGYVNGPRRAAGVVAALGLGVGVGLAAAQDAGAPQNPAAERILEVIAERTSPMTVGEAGLGGPGGELLLREAREASVLAIGESHLNEETPAVVRAALPALLDAGYAAMAIETGRPIAEYVESMIVSDRAAIERLFARDPFSAAFIDHVGELDLIEDAVRGGMDLWGLDQVFAGGARFNLGRLAELAPSDEARSLAIESQQRAREGFMHFVREQDQSRSFLNSATAEDYAVLRRAFAGVDEALGVIDELERSAEIYRLFGQGRNYASNLTRIELMREHFAEDLASLPEGGKIVLKFGDVHMRRGYSPLNQQDLGTAVVGIGDALGGGSLHVFVFAKEYLEGEYAADGNGALVSAMGDEEWVVVDLRAMRPIFHREQFRAGFESLSDYVWGYDLMVVTRSFTPAETVPGVPALRGR